MCFIPMAINYYGYLIINTCRSITTARQFHKLWSFLGYPKIRIFECLCQPDPCVTSPFMLLLSTHADSLDSD